jgi:hypothetical protein
MIEPSREQSFKLDADGRDGKCRDAEYHDRPARVVKNSD